MCMAWEYLWVHDLGSSYGLSYTYGLGICLPKRPRYAYKLGYKPDLGYKRGLGHAFELGMCGPA